MTAGVQLSLSDIVQNIMPIVTRHVQQFGHTGREVTFFLANISFTFLPTLVLPSPQSDVVLSRATNLYGTPGDFTYF